MKRRLLAIHESGHAVIAHYSGVKIKKIYFDKEGGKTETDELRNTGDNLGAKYIWIACSGLMAQTLYYGSSILYADIDKIKELNIAKFWT